MTSRLRVGMALVAALGALVFFLLTVGSLGGPRPELTRIGVADVLEGTAPADRFGGGELHVSGWYAELAADCTEPTDPGDGTAGWLERTCPLRVLMPYQPAESVTQAELQSAGLRLASETGAAFPSRARPDGPNLRLQQLVFVGHFDDPAAGGCAPQRRETCRNTFVVSDYDGLIR